MFASANKKGNPFSSMILTIAGSPGTGKTSVGKILADKLGYRFYSMGGLRGNMALEKGLTLDELNALGEQESSTDIPVDEYQKELGQKEDNFVIEGRLSWHFIPHSFKILLTCDPAEAARRIYLARKHEADTREDEPLYASPEEAEKVLRLRVESDKRRYQKYYGIDYQDQAHYDLVIDTTDSSEPEETAERILAELRKRGQG